jgi:hypothetical protein
MIYKRSVFVFMRKIISMLDGLSLIFLVMTIIAPIFMSGSYFSLLGSFLVFWFKFVLIPIIAIYVLFYFYENQYLNHKMGRKLNLEENIIEYENELKEIEDEKIMEYIIDSFNKELLLQIKDEELIRETISLCLVLLLTEYQLERTTREKDILLQKSYNKILEKYK